MKGLAKPGDYVVCLGAGNITQWAYALPGELRRWRLMSFPDIVPELKSKRAGAARPAAGRTSSLAELTWFRVGGPAQVLFMPEDESDLAYFLGALARRNSGDGDRRSAPT